MVPLTIIVIHHISQWLLFSGFNNSGHSPVGNFRMQALMVQKQ
jgi:hypothetical protein